MCNKDIWLAVQTAISRKNSLLFPKSQFPHAGKKPGGKCSPLFVGMGLSTCSLNARLILEVFDGLLWLGFWSLSRCLYSLVLRFNTQRAPKLLHLQNVSIKNNKMIALKKNFLAFFLCIMYIFINKWCSKAHSYSLEARS